MRPALLALVLVGCGGDEAATVPDARPADDASVVTGPTGVVSGSRLRARYFADANGQRAFIGWRDTQLGLDCSWDQSAEPSCLPEATGVQAYADAACTQPLLTRYAFQCDARPTHVLDYDTCGTTRSIYLVGAQVTPAMVYVHNGGACEASVPTATYFSTTPDPSAATYARGMIVDRGTTRVRTRLVVGADGSQQPLEAYDTTLATTCFPFFTAAPNDANNYCLPRSMPSSFSDASDCSTPVAFAPAACPIPDYIDVPNTPFLVYRRGAQWVDGPTATTPMYRRSRPTDTTVACSAVSRPTSPLESAFHAGEQIPASFLPPVTRVIEPSTTSRLSAAYFAIGDYRKFDLLHDVPGGFDCAATRTSETEWRCLPPFGAVSRRYFDDAACTTSVPSINFYGPDRRYATEIIGNSCGAAPTSVKAYSVGAVLAPSSLYHFENGTCVPGVVEGDDIYALGSELPLDAFVAMTPIVE